YVHSRTKLNIPPPEYGYYKGSIVDLFQPQNSKELKAIIRKKRRQGEYVGFIGGPPCPDFSIGGKNRGKDGENGKLSLSYIELIISQKPDFFLFENVKGLWRTKQHRSYYEALKQKLIRAGYSLTDRLINATEYGAPQDRDRIIMFGALKNLANEINPLDKGSNTISSKKFDWDRYSMFPNRKAFVYPWPDRNPFKENSILSKPAQIPEELTVEAWFKKNKVSSHANSIHCFKPRAGLKKFLLIEEGDDSKKCFKRLHRWRYSPTACYGNNEVHLHPYKARRLTVSEALAIQSLPKEYELPESMTLTDMFKVTGNGVPFLVGKNIARMIKTYLGVKK
ncbi:DNA cytosine methyltransferase, partial [Candidatus Margulisiibacteriota bacterium]